MKIRNKINYLMVGVLLLLVSCSEDFLNEKPTGTITNERISEVGNLNPRIAQGGVLGMYSFTFKFGSGGIATHQDFGQKSFDITSDILCGDMAQLSHAYGHFRDASNFSGTTKTGNISYRTWRYYYQLIRVANDLLESLNNKMPEDENLRYNYGQAKALRGYSYLYLVNFFQNPYLEAKDKKAVVLSLKNDGIPKGLSTVEEVYNVIIEDLEVAVTALDGFVRTQKSSINQNVARGLLVYAYLFKGDFEKAEKVSNDIILSNEFTLMSKDEVVKSGFNHVSIPGWMWAIDLTTDNSPQLPTFWGMIDIFTYSYATVTGWAINKELYDQIPDTDIRKTQFGDIDEFKNRPINKFYDSGRQIEGDRTWTNDEVYMRVAEFYLAKAEAQARQGKDEDAKKTLLDLLKERDTDAENRLGSLSGDELLDEIYFQWRVEMWGEGKALWAMKRFKKTNKRGSNSFMFPGESFSYNDERLITHVPEVELNSNPEISK